MALKPLYEACTPREDVMNGGLSDNHFAAQLGKVVRNPQEYAVYGDPEAFFAVTYPTGGLRTLLTKAFGRVTGASGPAGENGVLRSETSFGGGKTHGLTAVYHLARGARPSNLSEFVDPSLLPDGPVQVAAIVGDDLDPSSGLLTNGTRTYTIWGEMAAQIGPEAVAVLANNERDRTAPSRQNIEAAFGEQPTIVIIDEIAQHLRQAAKSGNPAIRAYASQIPVFLKNLSETAGDPSSRVSLIITLASKQNAFGHETDEITELLEEVSGEAGQAIADAKEQVGRMVQPEAIITPASDVEIGEILKRRLFETIDPAAAADAAHAYQGLYEDLLNSGEQLSGGPENPATYAKAIERAYPFHPELVRVLDKRLGAIPRFQRARGALKLLAEVVAGIYRDGDDCAIINVADIDYDDEPVRNHLTIGLERPEYANVAKVDLAGGSSHTALVDRDVFPGKPPYATRVARTVFTHSLEMTMSAGAGRAEWIVGTMQPGDTTALLEKALAENERVCWHLSSDLSRWRFHTEPNVNAILEEEKNNVQNTRATQALDDAVHKAFCNDAGATTVVYPTGPAAVPDVNELRIVVIDPDQRTTNGKTCEQPDSFLVSIRDTTGQAGAPRRYRNAPVFVVADDDHLGQLKDRIRAQLAAEAITSDAARMATFDDSVRRKIEEFQKSARLEARIAITRCFKHVYYPYNDSSHQYLRHADLPPMQQGSATSATKAVVSLLDAEQKIRATQIAFTWLKSKAWPTRSESVSTKDLADWFWIDHSAPILRDLSLVRDAIINGIKHDGWVYYDAATGKTYTSGSMAGLNVEFKADTELLTADEASKRGLLVRNPTANDLRGLVTTKAMTGTQLREALEKKCGGEPSKTSVLEALSTAVQQDAYQFVIVTDTPPTEGVRALTPSDIPRKGLDSLTIISREGADSAGVVVPGRTVVRTQFHATGPSGAALAKIIDQVTDSGKPLNRLSIRTVADETVGLADVQLLNMALGMLQQFTITMDADLTCEFDNITGALEFKGTGDRADWQKLNTTLKPLLQAASKVGGTLTMTAAFDPPIPITDARFAQFTNVIKQLNVTNTTMAAEVTK